jgi:hypothetical protein
MIQARQYHGECNNPDTDRDGAHDVDEIRDLDPVTPGIQNPFDPMDPDSTGDSFQDTADGVPDGRNDYDGDGMTNADEFAWGTNPLDPSSFAQLPVVTVIGSCALVMLFVSSVGAATRLVRRRLPRERHE